MKKLLAVLLCVSVVSLCLGLVGCKSDTGKTPTKADEKKAETPKADEKKAETPKADEKKAETPKADEKKADEKPAEPAK